MSIAARSRLTTVKVTVSYSFISPLGLYLHPHSTQYNAEDVLLEAGTEVEYFYAIDGDSNESSPPTARESRPERAGNDGTERTGDPPEERPEEVIGPAGDPRYVRPDGVVEPASANDPPEGRLRGEVEPTDGRANANTPLPPGPNSLSDLTMGVMPPQERSTLR